jgi:DNA repair ATPase RecN
MGVKVTRGDLEKASSTVRSGCDNISSNAKLATQSIEAFIQDSYQTLTGSGFDYVRSKMSLFLSATEKLASLCEMLANNIIQANNYMINETQGLDLDTSNIEELETRVNQINNLIRWYGEKVAIDDTLPEEEREYKERNKRMRLYYEGILQEIQEKLDLLKRLESIAASAAALLDSVSTDNTQFAQCVDSMLPSTIS